VVHRWKKDSGHPTTQALPMDPNEISNSNVAVAKKNLRESGKAVALPSQFIHSSLLHPQNANKKVTSRTAPGWQFVFRVRPFEILHTGVH